MAKEETFRPEPPEFTLKHLAGRLFAGGLLLGLITGLFLSWAYNLIIIGIIVVALSLTRPPRSIPRGVASIIMLTVAGGMMWSGLPMEVIKFIRQDGPYDPVALIRDPNQFPSGTLFALEMEALVMFCGGMTWLYSRVLAPIVRQLPKGWDTPVRYFFS